MFNCDGCGRTIYGSANTVITKYRECEDEELKIRFDRRIGKYVRYVNRVLEWSEPEEERKLCAECFAAYRGERFEHTMVPHCHCFGPRLLPVSEVNHESMRSSCGTCEKREAKTNGTAVYCSTADMRAALRSTATANKRDLWSIELQELEVEVSKIVRRVRSMVKSTNKEDQPKYNEILSQHVPPVIVIRMAELKAFLGIMDNWYLKSVFDAAFLESERMYGDYVDSWKRYLAYQYPVAGNYGKKVPEVQTPAAQKRKLMMMEARRRRKEELYDKTWNPTYKRWEDEEESPRRRKIEWND